VRARLRLAGLRPNPRRGQNFLCSPAVLGDIVAAAGLLPGDEVIEIGAGLGTLTSALAPLARWVTAVEVDAGLCRLLHDEIGGLRNVTVVCADITEMELSALLPAASGPADAQARRFKVVANLPYYLSTPLLQRMLVEWKGMTLAVVMLQEEVARRLVAGPGGDDYGSLSVFAGYYAERDIVRLVPASAFWPRPEVGSALVMIRRRLKPPVDADPERLFRVVRSAFGQRRKQVRNALTGPPATLSSASADRILASAGIDGSRRGETLSLEEFAALARLLSP
jgi:16S rRNA (adenine1518-N6/adenine1519-N6)-dimethyltransferase